MVVVMLKIVTVSMCVILFLFAIYCKKKLNKEDKNSITNNQNKEKNNITFNCAADDVYYSDDEDIDYYG